MIELLRTVRIVGLRPMLDLARAMRVSWVGMISGFYATRTLQALFNVGFFKEMLASGRVNAEAFARAGNLDARILKALCESLVSLCILGKDGADYYTLERKGRLLAEVGRGWFYGVYGYEDILHHLEALLKKEKTYGKDVFRRHEYIARGSSEMEEKIYYPLVADWIRRRGFKRFLDLGCGEGTFLRYMCRQVPDLAAYGIDIAPEAIEGARARAEKAGLSDRMHLLTAAISHLDELPREFCQIEVATILFVLHELLFVSEQGVVDFLSAFRRLFPGVPLVVFEAIRPSPAEMRRRLGMAVHYHLQHDLSNQKTVDRAAWRELFRRAGFESIEERYMGFARTSMFTLR